MAVFMLVTGDRPVIIVMLRPPPAIGLLLQDIDRPGMSSHLRGIVRRRDISGHQHIDLHLVTA